MITSPLVPSSCPDHHLSCTHTHTCGMFQMNIKNPSTLHSNCLTLDSSRGRNFNRVRSILYYMYLYIYIYIYIA